MLANPAALRVLPSAIVFLCALPAHAVVTTFEPYEQLSTTDVRAVLTDRFHRPQFDGVGATARFQEPLFVDENGDGRLQPEEYQVKAGESWTWIWRVLALDNVPTAGPFVWASVTSVYQGEPTRCFSNTPFCGSFLAGIRFTMTDKCIPEGDWEIELLHNDVSIGKQAFRPARFAPKPSIYAPFADTIEPVIPGQTAARHATGVRVRVEDDLGCGRPLNDVTVRFANTIATSGDHGHAHFSASEGGTGNYSCAFGFPCTLIDDGQDPEDTIVEGKTRTDDLFGPGAFVADYRARELGVRETIKLSLKREATAKDPEVTAPEVETELQIRYPGLVPVDAGPISAVANYGTGCPHDPVPSWMTIYSAANLADVAIEYKRLTGRQLSLNDASLTAACSTTAAARGVTAAATLRIASASTSISTARMTEAFLFAATSIRRRDSRQFQAVSPALIRDLMAARSHLWSSLRTSSREKEPSSCLKGNPSTSVLHSEG
jgi:hypothetical protein